MPRTPRVPAVLRAEPLKKSKKAALFPSTPRLWNAKRRIVESRGLTPGQVERYKDESIDFEWKKLVSQDVVDYIENNRLLPEEKPVILRNPSEWFSRPHHVPNEQRKQIYFPNFAISLRRTPHLGPYYAQFDVPLHFNKLDMKSYLKEAYDVDIIHVRSAIYQGKIARRKPLRQGSYGTLYRPASKKRMTVQLVDAFEWPEEVTDFAEWEKNEYWRLSRMQYDDNKAESDWQKGNPNEKHRKSIAEQAKDLLTRKATWKPTWQSLPMDSRVMAGSISARPAILPPLSQTGVSVRSAVSR